MDELALNYQSDFNAILQMIADARRKAAYQVNATKCLPFIGEFVSHKAVQDGWGRSTIKALSEYILMQEPGIRGYSPQNICRMKQFFKTYCDKPELGTLLRENTWSNNLHIMSKTKSDAERLFYLKMQFYLESLDRDAKKPHENPSVCIILCKSKDEDVVEYALSRNISPTMISEYRTKLQLPYLPFSGTFDKRHKNGGPYSETSVSLAFLIPSAAPSMMISYANSLSPSSCLPH